MNASKQQYQLSTLDSGIDAGQGINVRPGKSNNKNKRSALNKHRAWQISVSYHVEKKSFCGKSCSKSQT